MASVEKPGAGEKGGKIGCGWKGRENTEQLCQNGRESWETRRRLQVENSCIKKLNNGKRALKYVTTQRLSAAVCATFKKNLYEYV